MNRQIIVEEQLRDYATREKYDILLIQDPPTMGRKITGFDYQPFRTVAYDGDNACAAIIICTPALSVMEVSGHTSKYVATARVQWGLGPIDHVTIMSVCCKYSIPTVYFTAKVTSALNEVSPIVIGIDTNGQSNKWHCPNTNKRGRIFEELIEDHGLIVHNKEGQMATYCRRDKGSSNIDVTITDTANAHRVIGWCVMDETDSDHHMICYDYVTDDKTYKKVRKGRLNEQRADWPKFESIHRTAMFTIGSMEDTEKAAGEITEAIRTAAQRCMPRSKAYKNIGKPVWWSEDLNK